LRFCAANPLNPSTPPRNNVTNHSSEHDSLEDSDLPNVEDINDPVKLKELLQEYLQKYKDLSRQVSNDGAGGGVVLGSVDEECAAARKEGDEQEQRLSRQDAAERGGSTSSPSTPMTADTPNTKLGAS
jgi:hypothetical protein